MADCWSMVPLRNSPGGNSHLDAQAGPEALRVLTFLLFFA